MWLFKSKNFYKELEALTQQLKKFGSFPENWLWKPEKISALDEIAKSLASFSEKIKKKGFSFDDPALEISTIERLANCLKYVKERSRYHPHEEIQAKWAGHINSCLTRLNVRLGILRDITNPQSMEVSRIYIEMYPNQTVSQALQTGMISRTKLAECLVKIGPFIPEAILLIPFMENLVRLFKENKTDIVYAIDRSGRILGFLFHAVLSRMGLAKRAKFYFMNVYHKVWDPSVCLYSKKQKSELKNKNILVIDDYAASGSTINTAIEFFKSLAGEGKVVAAVFSSGRYTYSGSSKLSVSTQEPSWYAKKEYSGVYEPFGNAPVKVDKGSLKIAKDVRNALLPLADLIADYLKKKGY